MFIDHPGSIRFQEFKKACRGFMLVIASFCIMAQKVFWRLLNGSTISYTRLAEKEVAGSITGSRVLWKVRREFLKVL